MKCISCNKETTSGTKIPCSNCGEEFIRCNKCRGLSIEYECTKCKYRGP